MPHPDSDVRRRLRVASPAHCRPYDIGETRICRLAFLFAIATDLFAICEIIVEREGIEARNDGIGFRQDR